MSKDKFGPYIQRLMTTVLDKEQDKFVIDLAWNELNRLNVDLKDFLVRNQDDDTTESEETVKQLLQEEKSEE
jgi:hypothetical protein|tara:strand:+ start:238 stop:453 length:216 start_codon:yes stop_codon:yes gene_type:complete